MANILPVMPDLFGNVQEDTRAVENTRANFNHDSCDTSSPSEMSIQTSTITLTHHIQWKIDGRTLEISCMAGKAEARGVISATVERNGHEFKMELCASGWRNSQDGYSAFYLTVKDDGEPFVARYRVHTDSITRTSSIRHDFQLGVGFPSFCEQSMLTEVGCDQSITFFVTVEEFKRHSNIARTRKATITSAERMKFLSKALHNIYEDRLHTDVILVCQGQQIPTHKAVLASCSPVFRAMFEHAFMERSNEVIINDFSPQTIRSMIRFLYTGQLDESQDEECQLESESDSDILDGNFSDEEKKVKSWAKAMDVTDEETLCDSAERAIDLVNDVDMHVFNLFRFGEMYEITALVVACCRKMHDSIRVDNICKLLIPLSRYTHVQDFTDMQASLWEFFKDNYHEIKKTAGFRILLKQHPNIVCELLDNLTIM